MIDIVFIYALLAATFPLEKVALSYCSALFFSTTRMLLGGVILIGYARIVNKQRMHWSKNDMSLLAILTVCNVFIPHLLPCWSLHYVQTSKAALMYNMTPFFAALYGQVFAQEQTTTKEWMGMLIGFYGLYVLLNIGNTHFCWADMTIVATAAITVFGWQAMQKVSTRTAYSPAFANGVSMLCAGFIGLLFTLLLENQIPYSGKAISMLWYMIPVTLISNVFAYNYFNALLKRYSITLVSFVGFIVPVFVAFYGWIFCNEIPGTQFYVSLPIVCMGFVLFYYDKLFTQDVV